MYLNADYSFIVSFSFAELSEGLEAVKGERIKFAGGIGWCEERDITFKGIVEGL